MSSHQYTAKTGNVHNVVATCRCLCTKSSVSNVPVDQVVTEDKCAADTKMIADYCFFNARFHLGVLACLYPMSLQYYCRNVSCALKRNKIDELVRHRAKHFNKTNKTGTE